MLYSLSLSISLSGCGEDFTALAGQFNSPGYPNLYPHAYECYWTIIVPITYSITLAIQDFELEEHPTCDYDALEVDITPVLPGYLYMYMYKYL